MSIDWVAKLRNLLQTLAFCLAVATIQLFPSLMSKAVGVGGAQSAGVPGGGGGTIPAKRLTMR